MNWRLIVSLSGFGLVMGIASVLGLTQGWEGLLWLLIGVFCALWMARRVAAKHFRHGFLAGLLGGCLAPLLQAIFFATYLDNNPQLRESFQQIPAGIAARTFVFLLIPVIAILSGLALGLLTWAAGKIIKVATASS